MCFSFRASSSSFLSNDGWYPLSSSFNNANGSYDERVLASADGSYNAVSSEEMPKTPRWPSNLQPSPLCPAAVAPLRATKSPLPSKHNSPCDDSLRDVRTSANSSSKLDNPSVTSELTVKRLGVAGFPEARKSNSFAMTHQGIEFKSGKPQFFFSKRSLYKTSCFSNSQLY